MNMMMQILRNLAVPRPNHSEAVDTAGKYLQQVLAGWDIPYTLHHFSLRPHVHLLVGLACLLFSMLFVVFIFRRKTILAALMVIAIAGVLIAEVELFTPVVSWLIQKPGTNITVNYVVPDPVREVIFCAHYDSKTDVFDHIQRGKIYQWILHSAIAALLLSLLALLDKKGKLPKPQVSRNVYRTLAFGFPIYWTLVFIGFGGYIALSTEHESPGAVDNGGAVVTMLAMVKDIHDGKVSLGNSNITFVFTQGEEVNLQGSHHYVDSRVRAGIDPGIPPQLVNLELVGQNGNMIYWEKVGMFLRFQPIDTALRDRLNVACKDLSGTEMSPRGRITDDSYCYMRAGIPVITVGHAGIPGMGLGGFHSPADNMQRVNPENLSLMVRVLERFIESYGRDPIKEDKA